MKFKNKLLLPISLLIAVHCLADPPATHGMLLFGNDQTYFSHLPMFHRPHNYQAIFRIDLGKDAKAVYDAVKGHFEEQGQDVIFTFLPEDFVLPEMIAHPRHMSGTLFLGHFEGGGQQLMSGIKAQILQVMYAEKMPGANAQASVPLEYLLFGTPSENYMVHLIKNGAPNYDHVVQIKPNNNVHPGKVRLIFFPHGDGLLQDQKYRTPPISSGMVTDEDSEEDFKIEKIKDIYFNLSDLKS